MSKQKKEQRVLYAQAVFGDEEVRAVGEVLKDPTRIGMGPRVQKFEERAAKLFGKKYGLMVNSGSSANLLAMELVDLPRGSEIITPALTFGTTVAPIVQKGYVPAFVDVVEGTYQIDVDQIESMITKKTRALMIPSLLGNLPDFPRLRKIAKAHDLWFVEDSCDTIGATYNGKPTGHYSDISTTSFYASHIITTAGIGALIAVNDFNLAKRANIMSKWGRESSLFGYHESSEDIKKRFKGEIDGEMYDAKFIFSEIGYNFQVTDMNGAFGLEQLKRLPKFKAARKRNFKKLFSFFKHYEDLFILPVQDPKADTPWLAFPLIIRDGAPFTRGEITRYFEEHNIQTRPVFTGNICCQPGFKNIESKMKKGGYPVADRIMRNAFVIGCHQALTDEQLEHIFETFEAFLKTKR